MAELQPMLCFFDTSALQHRYITTDNSQNIESVISDSRNECFISNVSILEIASTFGTYCRRNKLRLEEYRRLDRLFWADVRSGALKLRDPRWREYRKALHLLEYAGAFRRRKITSFDALIAASCLELALERSTTVNFYVEDRGLYNVTSQLAAYNSVIDFHFMGTSKTPPSLVQRIYNCTGSYLKCLMR